METGEALIVGCKTPRGVTMLKSKDFTMAFKIWGRAPCGRTTRHQTLFDALPAVVLTF